LAARDTPCDAHHETVVSSAKRGKHANPPPVLLNKPSGEQSPRKPKETVMMSKIACALVATAVLSVAALAPTSASARGLHGGFHAFYGYGGLGVGFGKNYVWKGFCWRPYAYVCQ
jgi:hypothetical protein